MSSRSGAIGPPLKRLRKSVLSFAADSGSTLDSAQLKVSLSQSALEFCPIHCPNGRLGQALGFGGFGFALKLPELLNRNLAAVRAKLGQTSCFPNGPQIWCPKGQ